MSDRYQEGSEGRNPIDESGFTLVELLIVILVLGVLAAVTVLGLSNITGTSLTSACRADAKSVAVAQEAYRAQNGVFAGSTTLLETAPAPGPYLRSLPGNVTHYVITTGTDGKVLVQNLKTNAAGP